MSLSRRLGSEVDRWLFEEYRYGFEKLGLYRIAFAAYLLVFQFPTGLGLQDLPAVSFSPPVGLAALFQAYPAPAVVLLSNAVAMAFVCLLLVGLYTPIASCGVGISYVLVRTWAYSDGKIDHDILLPLTALVLAFSGWGKAYSLDALTGKARLGAPETPRPWLFAMLSMLIGFGLLTAGTAKIKGGWLSPSTQATLWYLLTIHHAEGRVSGVTRWALENFSSTLWELQDWAATFWESSFVLSTFRRSWYQFACAFGCLFHLGVWQLFDISFAENVVVYAAILAVGPDTPALLQRRSPPSAKLALLAVVPFIYAIWALATLRDAFDRLIDERGSHFVLILGVVVALGYLIHRVRSYSRG